MSEETKKELKGCKCEFNPNVPGGPCIDCGAEDADSCVCSLGEEKE